MKTFLPSKIQLDSSSQGNTSKRRMGRQKREKEKISRQSEDWHLVSRSPNAHNAQGEISWKLAASNFIQISDMPDQDLRAGAILQSSRKVESGAWGAYWVALLEKAAYKHR